MPDGLFTPREVEILAEIALGASWRQAATRLNVSVETVRSHMRRALKRTHAGTSVGLVALAISHGHLPQDIAITERRSAACR
jgi:DNA-binding CsgD family transcriptional regulator